MVESEEAADFAGAGNAACGFLTKRSHFRGSGFGLFGLRVFGGAPEGRVEADESIQPAAGFGGAGDGARECLTKRSHFRGSGFGLFGLRGRWGQFAGALRVFGGAPEGGG